MHVNHIQTPISPGELIDKITILRLKKLHLTSPEALENIQTELSALEEIFEKKLHSILSPAIDTLIIELQSINASLWEVEDSLRIFERNQSFDTEFIELARSVYKLNDKRAESKRKINEAFGSSIIEEKSYGKINN
ncbi:MAG: hypothetical protein CMM03_03635 [Rhodopirellula sp.]|nr:hypothetical protein [Rhodopirellula sp.]